MSQQLFNKIEHVLALTVVVSTDQVSQASIYLYIHSVTRHRREGSIGGREGGREGGKEGGREVGREGEKEDHQPSDHRLEEQRELGPSDHRREGGREVGREIGRTIDHRREGGG